MATSDAPQVTGTTAEDRAAPPPRDTLRQPRLPGWLQPAVLVALLVVLAIAGQFVALGTLSLLTTMLMVITIAQGWNILSGYGGYLNLGMAAFFGIGAYTTAILFDRLGWPLLVGLPFAGASAALAALLVGVPSLRLRGAYFAILTLVLGFLVQAYAAVSDLTRGALGIFVEPPGGDPRTTEEIFFYSYLALAAVAVVIVILVERSKFGYALRAIREDEDAAEVLGVHTMRIKMEGLLAGAALAGVAGGLSSFRTAFIEPTTTFDIALSIDVVLMSVVGGTGTWQGPLIGVPLVLALSEVLRVGIGQFQLFGRGIPLESTGVALGIVLVVVALFARRGVVGLFRQAQGRRFGV